jgi:hypothetical protein
MPLGGQIVNGHTYPVEAIDRRNSMQKIDITSVDLGDLPAMLVLVSTDILHLQPLHTWGWGRMRRIFEYLGGYLFFVLS